MENVARKRRAFLLFTSLTVAAMLMLGCSYDYQPTTLQRYGTDCLYNGTIQNGEMYPDGAVVRLRKSSISTPAIIIFLPDGYSTDELQKGGLFESDAKEAMEACLSIEPFTSLKHVFDFRIRITKGGYDVHLDKKALRCNYEKVEEDAKASIPYGAYYNTIAVVLTRLNTSNATTRTYFSTSGSFSISTISTRVKDDFEETVQHEVCGHGFGRLDDEYNYLTLTAEEDPIGQLKKLQSFEYGARLNVSVYNNNSSWDHLIGRKGYEEVGYYEGGSCIKKGVWRSEYTSVMRNCSVKRFNAISREIIWKRAMSLMGKEFSLEEFLDYDRINLSDGKHQTKSDTESRDVEFSKNHISCVHQIIYRD